MEIRLVLYRNGIQSAEKNKWCDWNTNDVDENKRIQEFLTQMAAKI